MRRVLASLAAATVVVASPAQATASELIARNATKVRLAIDGHGRAVVHYREGGVARSTLAWGAVNARRPSPVRAQVAFTVVRSSGGAGSCRRYDGPRLPWLVAACAAPDGSYWAVQRWQRLLPNYGLRPNATQAAWELRLSHWTGAPARLEIKRDWSYRRFDHLYGRLTYQGWPVHGFRVTPAGSPLDTHGRNLYVDTFNSAYGRGWERENSFLAQKGTGAFCYGFYPHGARPIGRGARYRATVIGPGVSPDVSWEGRAPGPYDRASDGVANAEQLALFRGRGPCKVN